MTDTIIDAGSIVRLSALVPGVVPIPARIVPGGDNNPPTGVLGSTAYAPGTVSCS